METDKHIHRSLVEAARRGKQSAYTELYALYAKAMYNAALRITGETCAAEEAMQDGFIKAFGHLGQFQFESTFGAWLKRIVVNSALDILRKKKLDFDFLENLPENIEDEIDDYSFEEEEVTRVKLAISQLPEGYRIICNLIYFEGYDHDEISEILGITASTSRSQLARARQKLVELLKKKHHG